MLGRILRREPVQLFPDTFLSEPGVSPSEVAALVGYDQRASDLFELSVAIMGYYDSGLGSFVNPWIPPSSGTPIYLADDAWLTTALSRKAPHAGGSALIGSLLTRPDNAVPVVFDVKDMVSTHLAIIASTGAGKSYLASVIVEELMRPYNGAAVLVIDPHGEYASLQDIANHDEFSDGEAVEDAAINGRRTARGDEAEDAAINGRRTARGDESQAFMPASRAPAFQGRARPRRPRYRAATRLYKHDEVKVRLSTLTLGDLRYLLPGMTDKQHHFLGRAYEALRRAKHGAALDGGRAEEGRQRRGARQERGERRR